MKREILYRAPNGTTVTLTMKDLNQLVKDKGIGKAGDVQMFHTQNVLRRIKRYMPFRTGATYKLTFLQTDIRNPFIITDVPYGKYLYHGKVMVNAKTGKGSDFVPGVGYRYNNGSVLKATGRDLTYTKTKNPKAGPYWDRTLVANEGKAMTADLQRFIDRRK